MTEKEELFLQNWNSSEAVAVLGERLTDFETGEVVQGELRLGGYEVRILVRMSILLQF